jgi:DNA-binding HxlR family transcriptional regulator
LGVVLLLSVAATFIFYGFRSEKGILKLHVVSFIALNTFLILQLIIESSDVNLALLMVGFAGHAILSLSYLEIWSLLQGGYSVQIMSALRDSARTEDELKTIFAKIGDEKRTARLNSLHKLGLIKHTGESVLLTPKGRLIQKALTGLLNMLSIKENA